jgi:hypothetical protein
MALLISAQSDAAVAILFVFVFALCLFLSTQRRRRFDAVNPRVSAAASAALIRASALEKSRP